MSGPATLRELEGSVRGMRAVMSDVSAARNVEWKIGELRRALRLEELRRGVLHLVDLVDTQYEPELEEGARSLSSYMRGVELAVDQLEVAMVELERAASEVPAAILEEFDQARGGPS